MAKRGEQRGKSMEGPLTYTPDFYVPPGDTLKETIETLHLSQSDLAARANLSIKHVNQIIQGVAAITPETALTLEKVTNVPARMWNRLESNYREAVLRSEHATISPKEREWLRRFPFKELVNRGAIQPRSDGAAQMQEILRFFGVANRKAWEKVWLHPQAAFRQSKAFEVDPYALASWLRLGELDALEVSCSPFDRTRFKRALREARNLTTTKDPSKFVPRLVELCAAAGVAVVFVREIQGSRASGAARWLSPTKAVIQLSLRHRTDDHLWFSFFHEAGHILLHGKKDVFIEVDGASPGEKQEDEANRFSATTLVPLSESDRLMRLRTLDEIQEFATDIGIAPGIVVGRLQKEGILDYSRGNRLKTKFKFTEET